MAELSPEDLGALEETVAILSDPKAMPRIQKVDSKLDGDPSIAEEEQIAQS